MNKSDFTGTGKVCAFTLKQLIRSRANIISLVILCLFMLAYVPVMTLVAGDTGEEITATDIKTVYILNETDYVLQVYDVAKINPAFKETDFKAYGNIESFSKSNNSNDVLVHIFRDGDKNEYRIDTYTPENTNLGDKELSSLSGTISKMFDEAKYRTLGATEEQLSILMSRFSTNVSTVEEYNNPKAMPFESIFVIQYVYSIFVMMLTLMSATYIIRTVIEEKASKLVELLMVSVKPLALILGKILAVMTYIFGMLAIIASCFGASLAITGMITDVSSITGMLASFGITSDLLNINAFTVVIVLVSLILSYLTFSILSGIIGTGCSSMEDVEPANMTVVLIILTGYLVSCISAAMGSNVLAIVTSLIPVVSAFCAPVHYVLGNISLPILCLSWLIQTAVIALLAWLCSRIYGELIIRRGSRIKIKELFALAHQKHKAKKEANI